MQSTSAPAKYIVPFAQNDGAKVEIPVTTTDATRASQSLGFPPLTMQPPETGGVPPQGEDFNGAMNQLARVAWWVSLLGSSFVYDAAFAANANILGYPKGSQLLRADLAGLWLNNAENNQTDPDNNAGTSANWLPGYTYGSASIAVTVATTVYPVVAAKRTLFLTGTLTAASVVNLPAWVYEWRIIDNTVRAGFSLTVKTAAGTGVVIAPGAQQLLGDGTNITQPPESVAPATAAAHAAQASQVASGALGTATAGGTANAITASFAASPVAYASGQLFTIIASATNTTAMTAVLTLGGATQTSVAVVKGNNAPVAPGDFPVGYPGEFSYSSAFGALVLNNPANGNTVIASQAQTDAGTDNASSVSPLRLKNGFAISLTTNGYIKFPSWLGGLIIQWGTVTATATANSGWQSTFTLPLTFPTGGLAAAGNYNSAVSIAGNFAVNVAFNSTSQMAVCLDAAGNGEPGGSQSVFVWAIGR